MQEISKLTFNEALKKFEKIEKDLKLDESLINDIYWWDSVRYPLFQDILRQLNLLENLYDSGKPLSRFLKIKKKLSIILRASKIFFPRSPLWISTKSVIIWGHPRRKFDNGSYVDIYSDPFVKLLPESANYSVLERVEGQGHLTPVPTKNIYYAERLLALGQIFSLCKSFFVKVKIEGTVAKELEKRLLHDFRLNYNLSERITRSICNWWSSESVMRLFFIIKKPSHFFIIVSAGHEGIVSAAKSAGIPTYELQHGSPARGKLNYDYTSGIKKRSFPDYFLSFGDYWTNGIPFPIPKEKIFSFGYPYLFRKIGNYSTANKENTLLVISQPVHAKKLATFAIKILALKNNSIKVVFKPHPAEYKGMEPNYFHELREAGVTISDKNEDLYLLLSKAKWQVGVYSTALYEGLAFKAALFLLPLAGYEHMLPLVNSELAKVVESDHNLDFSWKVNQESINKLFSAPSKERISTILRYQA